MYGAGATGGNAERVLCGCAPVIALVAAQKWLLPARTTLRPSGSSPMQRKHCDDTQQAFPLIADYSDTAPREAAWLSDPGRQSFVSRTAAVSAVTTPAAPRLPAGQASSDRGGKTSIREEIRNENPIVCHRARKLERCRELLRMAPAAPAEPPGDYRERFEALTGRSLRQCPHCHAGTMVVIASMMRPRVCLPVPDAS
jgi:hypothetical protein